MNCQFCGKQVRTSRTVNDLPVCSKCYRKGQYCSDCGATTTMEHGKSITVYFSGTNGKLCSYGRMVCYKCLKNYEQLENYKDGELDDTDKSNIWSYVS